jgi:hypothetical protein
MAAPEGNQFWKLRASHGRELEYKTPDELQAEVIKYFEWCDEHPWYKNEAIKSGENVGEIIKVPTARPYTISGLCIYLGITLVTWKAYCERKDFFYITRWAEETIRTQKFEGAAVGAFNANIIARDLGLSEKSESNVKLTGSKVIIEEYGASEQGQSNNSISQE